MITINETQLTPKQNEILRKLFKKRIICDGYKPMQIVTRICDCSEKELKEMGKMGLVTNRGKGWKVVSLSKYGVRCVKGLGSE